MARTGRPPKRFDSEAWKTGFQEYSQSYEVRLHRRQNTFGGKDWRKPKKPPGEISPNRQMQIAMSALERNTA